MHSSSCPALASLTHYQLLTALLSSPHSTPHAVYPHLYIYIHRDKLCELMTFILEAFEGTEGQFQYSVVGHSGTGPDALPLVNWGKPPVTPKEKLKLVESLRTHAQYCNPGDATLEGTKVRRNMSWTP